MRQRVLLFGPQKELAGKAAVDLTLPPNTTVDDVLRLVAEAEPALADSIRSSRLAINHAFSREDQLIIEGDELALIGMISGG